MIPAGAAHRAMRAFPFADLAAITGGGPALILAPHQDDESLGCGGLIAAACLAGQPPLLVFLSDGTGSHPNSTTHPPDALRRLREREAQDAAAILGLAADRLVFLRLPDRFVPNDGPGFAATVSTIVELAHRHGCTRLLAPWRHDPHGDHLAAHRIAVVAAARAGIGLLSYPVWGWTLDETASLDGTLPAGHRLDISGHLLSKGRAIAAHASQLGGVITDDAQGFAMPDAFLQHFREPFEVFIVGDAVGAA